MKLDEYYNQKYMIELKLAEINRWFFDMSEKIANNSAPDGLPSIWARKTFDKVCLEAYKKHLLSLFLIPEHQLKRIEELMKDV